MYLDAEFSIAGSKCLVKSYRGSLVDFSGVKVLALVYSASCSTLVIAGARAINFLAADLSLARISLTGRLVGIPWAARASCVNLSSCALSVIAVYVGYSPNRLGRTRTHHAPYHIALVPFQTDG